MSVLKGVFLALLTSVFIGFWLGLVGFAENIRTSRPPTPLPEADAIVALTGGTRARLDEGMRLLAEGRGRRLLISGVNPKVKDAELAALLTGPPELFACCVDLGRYAEDTLGNAAETAAWARRNSFSRIILVTDDYHLPRSLAELRTALPEADLIGYPVATRLATENVWQRDLGAAGELATEYVKFLLVRAREGLLSLDGDRRDLREPGGEA
jgi:uncharacterized SAM-binding protein YcdF (DUF218 family)